MRIVLLGALATVIAPASLPVGQNLIGIWAVDQARITGSFVFAPGNKDLFAHVSETFGDNANPDDMLKAMG